MPDSFIDHSYNHFPSTFMPWMFNYLLFDFFQAYRSNPELNFPKLVHVQTHYNVYSFLRFKFKLVFSVSFNIRLPMQLFSL